MTSQTLAKGKLPDAPGVYFFLGSNRKVLYIGRATSLRNRVRSYFAPDIAEKRSSWIAKMLIEAKSIDFRKTDSVLEAILLEADLIKKFQPPYNTDEKDDKSFNCVVITDEDFPAVFIERFKNIDFQLLTVKGQRSKVYGQKLLAVYGPFPHGLRLQDAMKIIRRIFPYRDLRCKPFIPPFQKEVPSRHRLLPKGGQRGGGISPNKGSTPILTGGGVFKSLLHKNAVLPLGKVELPTQGKPCFNHQIGLCPGTCTGEITKLEYANTIRNLRLFFQGKKPRLLSLLNAEMKVAAKRQEFERANRVKKTIFALQHIQDIALLRSTNYLLRTTNFRVEAYDLSHFGGEDIVGAMTVVENGATRPSEYRLFKIREITNAHETKGLSEVLRRRFGHPEWKYPNLIVVDGNEVQRSAAEKVLTELKLSIPVAAVVKNEKHKPREIVGIKFLKFPYLSASRLRMSAFLANSEAHRLALRFQRRRRKKDWS